MTAAFDDDLRHILRQQTFRLLVRVAVQHAVLAAVDRQHAKGFLRQVPVRKRSQQDHARIHAGMFPDLDRRDRAAQRMPADIPLRYFRKRRANAVRGVRIEHRKPERHLAQHAQNAVCGDLAHQRRIRLLLHLAAGIEDQPDLCIARIKDQIAAFKRPLPDGAICGKCCYRIVIGMIVVFQIDQACRKQHRKDRDRDHDPQDPFLLLCAVFLHASSGTNACILIVCPGSEKVNRASCRKKRPGGAFPIRTIKRSGL